MIFSSERVSVQTAENPGRDKDEKGFEKLDEIASHS
jgi:hypothetical protein